MAEVELEQSAESAVAQDRSGIGRVGVSGACERGRRIWFGPASVIEADKSTTKYTYTPFGQVATEIDYAGTSYSIEMSYVYDAAGNVVQTTEAPVDSFGNQNGTGLVTTYAFDAQGRLPQQVTNAGGTDSTANQTTTTVYSPFDGTMNVATTTNPDGSTNVSQTYLDGSDASDGGDDETPEAGSEGVIASDTTDANGNVETAGSTWVLSSSDGGQDWTKTFTNVLGEQYLVQQSDPSSSASPGQTDAYSDALTTFNLNAQPIEQIGTDGTATFTIFDPTTGQAGATWTDVAGTGTFDPGIDPKTVTNESLNGTSNTDDLSTTGSQDDSSDVWEGGLDSSDTVDGMTTTTVQSVPTGPGDYTDTTANADGTKTVDTYADDLLMQEQQLGTAGAAITTTTYTYDDMRRLASQTDPSAGTGPAATTFFSYYQDGTQKSSTDPGQNPQTDNTPDPQANQPQTITLPDGTTQSETYDDQGNLISQSGAGQLAATYGYDTTGTGQLTSLTTSTGTTNWAYDPTTGQLQSKTFADGTQDTYAYNDKGQLASEVMPGMTGTFGYDAAGDQRSATYNDSITGLVQSTVAQQDDQGRAIATVNTDNGKTFTTTDAYTSLGDLQSETFGSAGNASVNYAYYPTSAFGSNGSPDALQSVTVNAPGGSVSQTYGYDPSSKRLQTITVNGITLTYSYLPNSDQVQSISAGDVTTTFTPDSSDGSRLGAMSVSAAGQSVYGATYGYNADDQRASDQITQTVAANDGSTSSQSQTLDYTYDPIQADALTQVTDGSGNVLYGFSYDGTGNFTSNGSLGSVNSVNEYSNLTYNARHDLINDGTDAYGYDALDRLISVTPDSPTTGNAEEQYGYDGQGRMGWEDVCTWSGSWVLSTTYHFVWSGDELIEKLDGNNNLLQQYT